MTRSPLLHAEVLQHGGERLHLAQQFRVGDERASSASPGVVDDRGLRRTPALHVAVDRVVAGVAEAPVNQRP
jgi:hypothetical protein